MWLWISVAINLVAAALFVRHRRQNAELLQRESRLPEATRFQGLGQRIVEEEARLTDLQHHLVEAESTIDRKRESEQWLATHEPQLRTFETERKEQETLRRSLQQLRTDVAELATKDETLKHQAASSALQSEQAALRLTTAAADLNTKTDALAKMREQVDALESRHARLSGEVNDLQSKEQRQQKVEQAVGELNEQAKTLTEQVLKLNEQASAAQLQRDHAQERVAALTTDLQQKQATLIERRTTNDNLQARSAGLKIEIAEHEAIASQHKQFKSQIAELTDQRQQLDEQVTTARLEQEHASQRLAEVLAQLAEQSQNLEQTESQAGQLQIRRDTLKAQLATLEPQVARHETLKADVDQLTERHRVLIEQTTADQLKADDAARQVAELGAELSDKLRARDEVNQVVEELTAQRGVLRHDVAELESLKEEQGRLTVRIDELVVQQRELVTTVADDEARQQRTTEQLAIVTSALVEKTQLLDDLRTRHDSLQAKRSALASEVENLDQLRIQHETLQKQIAALTERHGTLNEQVRATTFNADAGQQKVDALAEELTTQTTALQAAHVELEALTASRAGLKTQIEELDALVIRQQELNTLVEQLQQRIAELTERRDALNELVRATSIDADAERQKVEDRGAELATRTAALESINLELEAATAQRAGLKTQIAELDALVIRQQELNTQVQDLQQQIAELTERRDALNEQVGATTIDADAQRQKVVDLGTELANQTVALESARLELETLTANRAGLKTEVAQLEALVTRQQELNTQIEQLQQQIAELTERRDALNEQVGATSNDADAQRQKAVDLGTELENRTVALESARLELETLTAKRAGLKTEVAELEALVTRQQELNTQVEQLQQQIAELTERRDALNEQVGTTSIDADAQRQKVSDLNTELTLRTTALESARLELEAATAQRAGLKTEVAELDVLVARHKELSTQVEQLQQQHVALSNAVAGSETRNQGLGQQMTTVEEQLRQDTESLDAARKATDENRQTAQALLEQRNTLRAEIAELTVLSKTYQELRQHVDELTERKTRLSQQLASGQFELTQTEDQLHAVGSDLTDKQATLAEARQRVDESNQQQAQLSTQVKQLTVDAHSGGQREGELKARLIDSARELASTTDKLESVRNTHAQLTEQVHGMAEQKQQIEQTIETLNQTLKETRLQAGYRGHNAGPLSELWKPALIKTEFESARQDNEAACLNQMQAYLSQLGLQFPTRLLYAFHTSLKVQDVSPLVVLSGISGTGKSELARRYAEAMGIHFLNIAVQPRWDSPQDIFGFFNYLENQYRATELTRALVQMDPYANEQDRGWQRPDQWGDSVADRMLLVLLDEMNLARVEYYFSELLSRLEVRRGIDKTVASDRRKAEIALEVGMYGASDPTMRLFVDTNVLFVGTINEDETTQTLSDKVIDRANMLVFGRPARFETDKTSLPLQRTRAFLPFADWRKWVRSDRDLKPDSAPQVNRWIEQLNQALELVHKPFAFRTNLAIRSYAANYPDTSEQGLQHALADQVEQKILPKFRGLDPNEEQVSQALEKIVTLVDQWGDGALVKAIEEARSIGTRTHQFLFRGVDRMAPPPTPKRAPATTLTPVVKPTKIPAPARRAPRSASDVTRSVSPGRSSAPGA